MAERYRTKRRLEGLQATRKARGWRSSNAHFQLLNDLLPLLKKKAEAQTDPGIEESSNDFIEKAIEARTRELLEENPGWLGVLRANAELDTTGHYKLLLEAILPTDDENNQ